jgi:hypothetical protein
MKANYTESDLPLGATAAARYLEISYPTLNNLRRAGVLPALKNSSGHFMFRQADLEKVKQQRERGRS